MIGRNDSMMYRVDDIERNTVSEIVRILENRWDVDERIDFMKECIEWLRTRCSEDEVERMLCWVITATNDAFVGFLSRYFTMMYYAACDKETREYDVGRTGIRFDFRREEE